jgi:hypothetical protein
MTPLLTRVAVGQRADVSDTRRGLQAHRGPGAIATSFAFATFGLAAIEDGAPRVRAAELPGAARFTRRWPPGVEATLVRRAVAYESLRVVAFDQVRIASRAEPQVLQTSTLPRGGPDTSQAIPAERPAIPARVAEARVRDARAVVALEKVVADAAASRPEPRHGRADATS